MHYFIEYVKKPRVEHPYFQVGMMLPLLLITYQNILFLKRVEAGEVLHQT